MRHTPLHSNRLLRKQATLHHYNYHDINNLKHKHNHLLPQIFLTRQFLEAGTLGVGFSNRSMAHRSVRIGKIEHGTENADLEGALLSCTENLCNDWV